MFSLPKLYTYSPTAENILHLERTDFFEELPYRFLLSLLSIICLTFNLASILRFKPPNHFKTNLAISAWALSLLVQYKVLQLGKVLVGAPQRLYTLPDYGVDAEHHKMKSNLYSEINTSVRHIFVAQLLSTSVLAVSRDAHYALILIPLIYGHEDWRFALLLVYDFYLKLRKTPRVDKAICCVCIFAVFQSIERWTWLVRIIPLVIYTGISFRVLTSKL